MARALEHLKPPAERVVDDPWAHVFVSPAARRVLAAWSGRVTGRVVRQLGATGTSYVPLRHRFIDEHLAAALDAGIGQVVLLGAGYDTRAYRFADQLAGRPVFEVDLAAISRAKAATIAKHAGEFPDANVVRVEIDFESQELGDVLADAGFEVGGLAFFVWEGVPMYLTRAAVKATLDAVHGVSADGSQIAHDMWTWSTNPGRSAAPAGRPPERWASSGSPSPSVCTPRTTTGLLHRHGFAVVDVAFASELKPVTRHSRRPCWTTRCTSSRPNASRDERARRPTSPARCPERRRARARRRR